MSSKAEANRCGMERGVPPVGDVMAESLLTRESRAGLRARGAWAARDGTGGTAWALWTITKYGPENKISW